MKTNAELYIRIMIADKKIPTSVVINHAHNGSDMYFKYTG